MKALRLHRFGGPAVLQYEELPSPRPGPGQYLIAVGAAGVNPVDTKIRAGTFALYRARPPEILGRDVAGVVRAFGGGGRPAFAIGQAVFGMLDYGRGGYAGFTLATARELARRPARLPELSAGVLGVAALTAWQGLFDHGRLRRGQRVLIHGGAGGVGHLAVQFAKARGAFVVATASGADLTWVRSLGADQVIDHRTRRFEQWTGEIDLVFDLIAGETQDRSWQVLKDRGGILVSTLSDPSRILARQHRARGLRMVVKANRRQLEEIAGLVVARKVRVHLAEVFPLAQGRRAHQAMAKGHLRGKVALRIR